MRTTSLLLSLALLSLGSHSAQAAEPLVEIERCELAGFVAYGTAREAIVWGRKKDYWKLQPERSDFQDSFLDELYTRVDDQGFKDHLLFGAEKLVACLRQFPANNGIPEPSRFSSCFAETDVVFRAQEYKAGGAGLASTKRIVRSDLKDATVYPQEMLDRLIPLAYPIDNDDKIFDLQKALLHRCIDAKRVQK
jgi:hypothetical protein